jgi:hypothetical protein
MRFFAHAACIAYGPGESIMLRFPVKTAQRVADCRWSRHVSAGPGFHPDGADPVWVCVRPTRTTVRRPVTEEQCETCPHWEMTVATNTCNTGSDGRKSRCD